MSEKNFNNNEDVKNVSEEKDEKVYTLENPIEEENKILKDRKYINLADKTKHLDLSVYNELDDFAAEVLNSDNFLKYVEARREYLFEPEETVKKYFGEEFLSDENSENKIATFSDFYYQYLIKYSDSYFYKFMAKGYTEGFRNLLIKKGINPDDLNINWESIEKKEKKYQEGLVDILYAMISYELKKQNLAIFGINLGFDSVLYYITSQQAYERIVESQKLIKVFDLPFLEEIYNEIFEIVGDLGIKGVEIGDFIEKTDNGYRTLFEIEENNILISEDKIDEDDESKVKIIL